MHTTTSTLAWTNACACAHASLHACREKREEAAEAHARFRSREGDHLTLLAVFRAYTGMTRKGGERAAWCRSHFVNPRAMRKALDIHTQVAERPLPAARICMLLDLGVVVLRCPGGCARCSLATACALLACLHQPLRPCCCGLQLKEHLQALGIPQQSCGENSLPLRRALVAGLFPHAAKRQLDGGSGEGRRSSAGCFNGCCRPGSVHLEGCCCSFTAASRPTLTTRLAPAGSYKVIATGQAVAIHPSSVLAGKKPECIVFNELVSWPEKLSCTGGRGACARVGSDEPGDSAGL